MLCSSILDDVSIMPYVALKIPCLSNKKESKQTQYLGYHLLLSSLVQQELYTCPGTKTILLSHCVCNIF